jgi:hypothetical protein
MSITKEQAIEEFEYSLNEDGDVFCGSMAFEPARVLRELDPVAYRQDFLCFCEDMEYDFDLEDEEEDAE